MEDRYFYKIDKKGRKLFLFLTYYNENKRKALFSYTLKFSEKCLFDRIKANNMYLWNKKYFDKLGRNIIKFEPLDFKNLPFTAPPECRAYLFYACL